MQKGLQLIVRASVQQGSTRLRRLGIELYSDSFHAVLAFSCGRAKCQCCIRTVTVDVYRSVTIERAGVKLISNRLSTTRNSVLLSHFAPWKTEPVKFQYCITLFLDLVYCITSQSLNKFQEPNCNGLENKNRLIDGIHELIP